MPKPNATEDPKKAKPASDPAASDTDDDEDEGAEVDYRAEAEKWKGLARKHEATSKKNATAAERLAELEDADKSEIQRERDKAAAADARAKAAELRADRLEVAASKGLSPSLAARLVGETREELEADADELRKQLKLGEEDGAGGSGGGEDDRRGAGGRPELRGRPRENLRSGSSPGPEPEENDPKKLADLIPRG